MSTTEENRDLIAAWLDDDEALRIPDTDWGRALYAALREMTADAVRIDAVERFARNQATAAYATGMDPRAWQDVLVLMERWNPLPPARPLCGAEEPHDDHQTPDGWCSGAGPRWEYGVAFWAEGHDHTRAARYPTSSAAEAHLAQRGMSSTSRVERRRPGGEWEAMPTIEERIEASSLGTPSAKAARASVSDERAAAVVARARQQREEEWREEWAAVVRADFEVDVEFGVEDVPDHQIHGDRAQAAALVALADEDTPDAIVRRTVTPWRIVEGDA